MLIADAPRPGLLIFSLTSGTTCLLTAAFKPCLRLYPQVSYADGEAEEVLLAAERVRLRMVPGEALPPPTAAELAGAASALQAAAARAGGAAGKVSRRRAAQAVQAHAAALQRQANAGAEAEAASPRPPQQQPAAPTQSREPAAMPQQQRDAAQQPAADAQPRSNQLADSRSDGDAADGTSLPRRRPSSGGRRGFANRKSDGGDSLAAADLQPGDLVWAQVRRANCLIC